MKYIISLITFFSLSSFAATTGTLLLEGTVLDTTSIVIQPEVSAHRALDIVGGETNRLVGNAIESSNHLAGYTVTAKSANGGLLVHTMSPTVSTAYTMSYDGAAAVSLTTVDVLVKDVTSLSGLSTVMSAIRVNVTAFPTAPQGVYQDTITFTIQAR